MEMVCGDGMWRWYLEMVCGDGMWNWCVETVCGESAAMPWCVQMMGDGEWGRCVPMMRCDDVYVLKLWLQR